MVAQSMYEDACIVILPENGTPPRQLLDALVEVLETTDDHAPVLVVGQGHDGRAQAADGEEAVIPPIEELGPAAGAMLLKVGTKLADRVIDGATRVIRDQYKDNRAAQKSYDQRAAAYLRANDRYFGRT